MQIIDFTKEWLPEAYRLAEENYKEAREVLPLLPDAPIPPLEYFAENGLGTAAVEDGCLLGFLGCFEPWSPAFCTPDTVGMFSPLHAHAVQKENRERIWQRLYQSAGAKWAKVGGESHAIALYSHDIAAQKALYQYGFGARCADFIRTLTPITTACPTQIRFAELSAAETTALHPMRSALVDHLGQSPTFMVHTADELRLFLERRETEPPRMFAAFDGERPIAYIELTDEGENFASCAPNTANICGAYCLPEYRGQGIAQALLDHLIRTVQKEGILRLGVDCETFNPTAINFWRKYFTQYTVSVVRRIDENAVI